MADVGKYQKHIKQLGLSAEQGEQWVATIQRLSDNLLSKKYMLEGDTYEKVRKSK